MREEVQAFLLIAIIVVSCSSCTVLCNHSDNEVLKQKIEKGYIYCIDKDGWRDWYPKERCAR